jgi:hypothetical protein
MSSRLSLRTVVVGLGVVISGVVVDARSSAGPVEGVTLEVDRDFNGSNQ